MNKFCSKQIISIHFDHLKFRNTLVIFHSRYFKNLIDIFPAKNLAKFDLGIATLRAHYCYNNKQYRAQRYKIKKMKYIRSFKKEDFKEEIKFFFNSFTLNIIF